MSNAKLNNGGLSMMATVEAKPSALTVNKRIAQGCVAALLVTTMSLVSCKTKLSKAEQQIIDTPILCQVFEPINWVKSDTLKTREQINAYNSTWDYYCKTIGSEDE